MLTAFVLSTAHSCVVVCSMQTFDPDMALPWAEDSRGGSAPSATGSEGQGNTDGKSGTTRNYATLKCIELEMSSREIYPAYFLFTSWLSYSCTKEHFFPQCIVSLSLFWTVYVRKKAFISLYLYLWSPSSRLCTWVAQCWKTALYAFICHAVWLVFLKMSVFSLLNQERIDR